MLTVYAMKNGALATYEGRDELSADVIWLDLFSPSKDEELLVERLLGIEVPSREEMQEIEASSRLYQEAGAYVMTTPMLYASEGHELTASPVTFILTGNRLVTLRYHDAKSIQTYVSRAKRGDSHCESGPWVLIGLLESIIDRQADHIEHIQAETNKLSHQIFELRGGQASRHKRLDIVLRTIGRQGELAFRANDSVLALERLLTYLQNASRERGDHKTVRDRIKTAQRDVSSLNEHIGFLHERINFLLDATLGMINIEENRIIKIFSILAIVFMPPTLVASIYGMNFKYMPELEWAWGFWYAIGLMVLSAACSYWAFRKKGWM